MAWGAWLGRADQPGHLQPAQVSQRRAYGYSGPQQGQVLDHVGIPAKFCLQRKNQNEFY
jgi:hypothetical protein